jgi:4-hydroxy-4-methyl-2-oxoglutarate aldolase
MLPSALFKAFSTPTHGPSMWSAGPGAFQSRLDGEYRALAGPVRLDQREPGALATARFGPHLVTGDDVIFGDDDGVLFVAAGHAGQVLATARQIWQTEREQARRIRAGQTLRQQTAFDDYLARRAADPSYTFRQHLRQLGGAIEE